MNIQCEVSGCVEIEIEGYPFPEVEFHGNYEEWGGTKSSSPAYEIDITIEGGVPTSLFEQAREVIVGIVTDRPEKFIDLPYEDEL